ncbi:MAG TPA: division/cell wall cluster transcriptional repressor MraZ [Candidatus Paceibacterota bacterium]|nr:division/cell wall cluster transcriptional repressor MraZ [Candidatus Paceibacterota bacterium]HMP18858.1 division/cell wall cluster transcriptional repressor MraZ [Candidatus Paceibacterota bacterium]HMP85178.1 division/cell wall cluster transcriptional repressor MraZ [Candidatus Paceibacterota bacterium]
MLIGEYKHTLDDKKRISLPIKFRKEVGKKIIVTRGLDRCLFVYSLAEWQKISKKIGELGMGQADRRSFNRFMLSGASEILVDSIGRILIPEHLRNFANINEKVIFAGVYNRIEIWNENSWEEYKQKVVDGADEMAEKLGDIGAL